MTRLAGLLQEFGAVTIIVLLLSERNSVREPLVLNQVGGCTTVPDQRLSQARELNEGRALNDPGTESDHELAGESTSKYNDDIFHPL